MGKNICLIYMAKSMMRDVIVCILKNGKRYEFRILEKWNLFNLTFEEERGWCKFEKCTSRITTNNASRG